MNLKFWKKKEEVSEVEETVSSNDGTYFDSTYGNLHEGLNEESNVIVNVISRKKLKSEYKVGGVLDQEQNNNWKAWLYLAPVLILMAVFLIYPLINTIAIAFMEDYNYINGGDKTFTFNNFLYILGLKEISGGGLETAFTRYAIPNTFILVFITVPISIFIALIISVLLNKIKWFQKVYQTVFFLPYVTNTIAVGMVFSVLFDDQGVINYIFNSNIDWITGGNRAIAMVPLCLYIIWNSLPFKILILLSGLQNVDKQYYQAAKIDAAPQWKVLTRITVPALMPQILYLSVTSFIGAFKEYSSIVGLFGQNASSSGDNGLVKDMYTIVFYIYENLDENTSKAAAAAVFLFVIILVFTFLQLGISKRRQN